MTKEAIILHTVEDAKHCIANNLYQDRLLFSTHASVEVFLSSKHNLSCTGISSLFIPQEIVAFREEASQKVDGILSQLDREIGLSLNKKFGLNLQYFQALYGYRGKLHYITYLVFIKFLESVIENNNVSKFFIYDDLPNKLISTNRTLQTSLLTLNWSVSLKFINYKKNINKNLKFPSFKQGLNAFQKRKEKFFTFLKNKKLNKQKKTIILFENLYSLSFLRNELEDYNVIYYSETHSVYPIQKNLVEFNSSLKLEHFNTFLDNTGINQLFVQDILYAFNKDIKDALKATLYLQEVHKQYPIKCGIWGNSPVVGAKALIFNYLRSINISVIGAQHGGSHADQVYPLHFDSQYNKCDYFISYGFTKKDLERIYPSKKITTQFLSLGNAKRVTKKIKPKKYIDILFPITNNIAFLHGGLVRIEPNMLLNRQVSILNYLNSFNLLQTYVKPFPVVTSKNYAFHSLENQLKNLTFIHNTRLDNFLENYFPKAVIIEYPSTPLYELMELDVEIFLFNDPTIPYEEMALKQLQKRVHYVNNIRELQVKLDAFLKGRLLPKRDKTFYNHYVYKKDPKSSILTAIQSIID